MTAPSGTTSGSTIDPNLFQDPYAWWGLQTRFRAFMRAQTSAPSELTFLVELHTPYSRDTHFTAALAAARATASVPVQANGDDDGARSITIGGVHLRVPLAYERVVSPKGDGTRFITLRLSTDALPTDPSDRSTTLEALVQQLITTKEVKRMQIGFQRPAYRDKPQGGAVLGAGQLRTTPPGKPPEVVLGVVEDACPFGHSSMRDAAGSRVLALWDQSLRDPTTPPGPVTAPWTSPAVFPYGRTLSQQEMTALLAEFSTGGWVDEPALYADPRVRMFPLLQRKSHAAAVIDLLAGPSATLGRDGMDDALPRKLPSSAADAAVLAAPLVVVQLPREQTAISAGRWLAVNALDALHFVMDSARQLVGVGQPLRPLVVNVSYGAIAGPHDGTSLLESAVDELCDGYPNMAVVLAAGNAQGTLRDTDSMGQCTYLPGGVHATHDLAPGQAATLTLLVPADKPFETYLELWFSDPDKADHDDHWLRPGEVEVEVRSPSGSVFSAACGAQCFDPVQQPQPGNPAWLPSTTAGLVFVRKASQSLHRSMALLVVAATRVHPEFVEAPAGCWTLTLRNMRQAGTADARSLQVQAWVERDDSTYGIDRPQSARLVPNADGQASHINDDNILSNLASGLNTLSVGALVQGVVASPAHGMVSAHSAAGPSQNEGPELSALADAGLALSGIRTAGSQSGMVVRTNGTSMAAPLAARWIAQQLADGIPLADIKQALATAPGRDARRGMTVP